MKMLIPAIALVLYLDLITAAEADLALFNGSPVEPWIDSSAATAYDSMQAALERGEPQKLIIEYLTSGKKTSTKQALAVYKQIKNSTLQSFDPTEIKQLRDYSHLPMSVVRVNASRGLEQLMRHPQIKAVYEDTIQELFLNDSLPLIGQPAATAQGATGAGTAVAILDTGVDYTHPAFGSCTSPGVPSGCKVVYAQDFAPDDGGLDVHGHGTNVAGISLGVAPDTRILALDVFDGEFGSSTDIIAAINWSIANQATYNIAAINMSLGGGQHFSECTDVFTTPISDAKTAGILVAVASGNNGYKDSMASPACSAGAVSVGAVYDSSMGTINWGICLDKTAADQVTCFSNSAPFLDLLAPGALITAAGIVMGGTSQATPHVAGAAAVLAQLFPAETADQWLERLKKTGVAVNDDENSLITARIDIHEAINESPLSCLGDVLDIDSKTYPSGDIESCTAISHITFGPDVTVESGASVSLVSPEVTILAGISIAHGAIFSIITPSG